MRQAQLVKKPPLGRIFDKLTPFFWGIAPKKQKSGRALLYRDFKA